MITQENIKAVLEKLTVEQLKDFWESEYDMVLLVLNTFNAGFTVELKFATFSDDWEDELANGNITCDKCEFTSYLHFYEPKNWIKFYNSKDKKVWH
mgnify:CR=1 FL=1|tara:strand:+ start:65553 stop:65840 length:288 start_codon:yes stop_codon:yes gene_type:complete